MTPAIAPPVAGRVGPEFPMSPAPALKILFTAILVVMLSVTAWASLTQPVWQWGGLTGPDRAWTIATLFDAYAGFLTFYAFVWYRERTALARAGWLVAILLLGNMAMSTYMLFALRSLRPGDGPAALFARGTR